jgi:NAD(P)-dependent dehydrogenase (short-subunit alcohol dehydrogenase family)
VTATDLDPARVFDLAGRVAVVTGASSGLGHRFARLLAAAGATVVVGARRLDRLEELAATHPNIEAARLDVEDDESISAFIESVGERHGRVDVLVNNAGVGHVVPAVDESIERFRRAVEINLVSVFRISQLAVSLMWDRGGAIVNIGSIFGVVGGGDLPLSAYSASKAGVHGLTRDLAVQWAPRRIRVNALSPGYFFSEMTERRFASPDYDAWIRANAPLGRCGDEHELDGALLFLASDASSYVTGQTLVVDGGWTAR